MMASAFSFFEPGSSAALTARVLVFLLTVTIKGTILLLVAGALCLAFRRASAAVRHLIWTLAFAMLLALPFLTLALPGWRVRVSPPNPAGATGTLILSALQPAPHVSWKSPGAVAGSLPRLGLRPATIAHSSAPFWVLVLLAAGWAVVGLRMIAAELTFRRLVRRSRPFQCGFMESTFPALCAKLRIPAPIPIRSSSEIPIAMVGGLLRPLILLPEDAAGWSHERMEIVLTHELLHVRRRDCLTQWVAQAGSALYWFHPLVWLASSEMQKGRERATDDALLALGAGPADYAEHLLALARSMQGRRGAFSSSVAMGQISQLEARMKSLFDKRISHRPLN